jgi:hypothetical protein
MKDELPYYDDESAQGRCVRGFGTICNLNGHQFGIVACSHEALDWLFKQYHPGHRHNRDAVTPVVLFRDDNPPPPEDFLPSNDEQFLAARETPDDDLDDIFALPNEPDPFA